MSVLVSGPLSTLPTKLTGTTATDLYEANKRTTIDNVIVANTDASNSTFSLEMFDGTNSYYLYNSFAINSHTRERFDGPIVLPSGWKLRATAGHANRLTVFVTYMEPDASAQRSGYEAFVR